MIDGVIGYEPIAFFLNPFTLDTTRYCEEEGWNLIDPVTIPENFDDNDGFVDSTTSPFEEYDYECKVGHGWALNN